MITKLFRAAVAILALASLASMPVSAGQASPHVKISLKCSVGGPSEFPKITVENNTNSTIPNGATIYWSLNATTSGSITLKSALAPGGSISRSVEPHGNAPFAPRAWYFK